ncbi:GPI inositol deacylase [Claviceps africana]|uniref:GPI inositol-deacylase n=1 Tax=Claviceps africana TaxID=83212 RepID=A0A8K0NKU6_9HYPO|nr:GPI inositol deacylase [Claviceps africana]
MTNRPFESIDDGYQTSWNVKSSLNTKPELSQAEHRRAATASPSKDRDFQATTHDGNGIARGDSVEAKGCRMSYMRPSYVHFTEFDTEHTRFATKYTLYLYREQGIDDEHKLRGTPVLFVPGNAGSYKQVRPIAAEAATYFHDTLRHDSHSIDSGVRNLDFFTVDFNEDITAFHGQTLLDQAEYLNEAIRYILSLYSDPQRVGRDPQLPEPTSVIILGHSMGGVVARTMLIQSNYQANSINTIITMSAPHSRPPVTFDGQIVQIYDEINNYWRRAYAQKWANNNPLWHVTLISIAGGTLDTVVPSDYASVESLVPETHGFTVFTTGIPNVWTSMDHQAILWCDQFRKVIAKSLYDVINVNRASQTKPRADRMRLFRRRFLPGLEATSEKTIALKDETSVLTLDHELSRIVPPGNRFILNQLRSRAPAMVHLIPIPPADASTPKRFSLLTDVLLQESGDSSPLDVLVCIVSDQSGPISARESDHTSVSANSPLSLACKNVASDAVLLPASTESTRQPFFLEGEDAISPFSYLLYDVDELADYNFVAVVEKSSSRPPGFVIAEFSDKGSLQKVVPSSLFEIAIFGLSIFLGAERPMTIDVRFPALTSSLLAFDMKLHNSDCGAKHHLFTALVRQYLSRPYESKYFVNATEVSVSFHGTAPYLPPPLASRDGEDNGIGLQIWSDPTCPLTTTITLRLNWLGSLGKLYIRYRTVFAAFPLLVVSLVLRTQFRVYDQTGVFIPFSQGLDLALRRSIPLLLLCLTLIAASPEGSIAAIAHLFRNGRHHDDFHRHELLIGTGNPSFCFLVLFIGIICIGVCAVLHYTLLALIWIFGVLYGWLSSSSILSDNGDRHEQTAPRAILHRTPKRRMVSTALLLFLVSTFIPYQFAYLVACLVQLFTAVRAFHIATPADSMSNLNYYHYVHSILLLMTWVLPINLPILAVWIRNLAVHWLTPFSSHHNVLSIMPFILLVENLTTGRMVPRVTSQLRHVTSVLLSGTALCAAVYGVSHAYVLHYLLNIIATWLVILHSTADSWSVASILAIFGGRTRVNGGDRKPA